MAVKQLGLVAIGFAAGVLVASLLSRKLDVPLSDEVGASITGNAKVDRTRVEFERQIADLRRQVQSLQLLAGNAPDHGASTSALDDRITFYDGLRRRSIEDLKNDMNKRLREAGFTPERIEWITQRSEELEAERVRKEDLLRQQKGEMSSEQYIDQLVHLMDKDIGLRKELGDEEYAKYRYATGRSIGVPVSDTVKGGIGERAGLKPGDQIIAYNGVRIFNEAQLAPLTQKHATSRTPIPVDVVRNGQTIRLSAEGGNLRIAPPNSMISLPEILSRQKIDAALSKER